jgi:hypothetical protein
MKMPDKVLSKLIGSMQRRSILVKEAKGGHFEEGS